MAAACRGDTRADIPRSVACEYHQADRKKKGYRRLPESVKKAMAMRTPATEVTPSFLVQLANDWAIG